MTKISIITPSYNQGDYIEETIKSVLTQKGDFELEYIIMDGGSTDSTLEILKKYNKDIIWHSEKDRGQTHAINKGLKKATGDIVAYLNSDDLYEEGALEKVVQFFKTHPETKWAFGKCKIINEEGTEIRKWITTYKNFFLKRYSYRHLLTENCISQPATFWTKEVTEELGDLDESQHLVMDYEYWLRIGKTHPPAFINAHLANFRWYQNSKSGSRFNDQFKQEYEVAKKYADGKKLPLLLHKINYWKITIVYRLLQWLS